jgi:hypothetical protein
VYLLICSSLFLVRIYIESKMGVQVERDELVRT